MDYQTYMRLKCSARSPITPDPRLVVGYSSSDRSRTRTNAGPVRVSFGRPVVVNLGQRWHSPPGFLAQPVTGILRKDNSASGHGFYSNPFGLPYSPSQLAAMTTPTVTTSQQPASMTALPATSMESQQRPVVGQQAATVSKVEEEGTGRKIRFPFPLKRHGSTIDLCSSDSYSSSASSDSSSSSSG